ncbi:MAG: hypothetical protein ACFFD6_02490 [Candidatus Thorarchaeota archaeon]
MYSPSSTGGRVIFIGFMVIWILAAISMGFFFIDFAESWPDWGPGPHPSMFVWIPFAMAGFGVLVLVVTIISWVKGTSRPLFPKAPPTGRSGDDYISSTSSMTSGYDRREDHFEVPRYCSSCGSKIDSELIEWVGPMRFKCPSCGTTHRAE